MKKPAVSLFLAIILGSVTAFAEPPEKLLGLSTDFHQKTVTIEVAGSGCTTKENFRLEFKNDTLTVYRVKHDACKAMPAKASFTYSLADAGIPLHQPFKIGNFFIINENLATMRGK